MPGEAEKAKPGRLMPTVSESILWTQRIEKEQLVNGRAQPQFSLRNAVGVVDVPAKFKPGHMDPSRDDKGLKPFDPADNGWDPQGADAQEFQRCLNAQRSGPRDRQAYPLTTAQEQGWLLAPHGEPGERVRMKRNRMGLGWECKHPSEWSESTAAPPPVLAVSPAEGQPGCRRSVGSQLSAAPPASILSNAPPELPSHAAAARASQVSGTAPTQLSRASEASGSELSRCTSLPAIRASPAERLRRREERLDRAMAESARFLNRGDCGHRYARPLGMTDVTKFDDDFIQANSGVPLYKTGGSQEVVLKDVKLGTLAAKWK